MDSNLITLASDIGTFLKSHSWRLVTAESCTGGLVAAAMTEIAGSSDWFERGFVTYSNEAKIELLDVSFEVLSRCGAVSEPTVSEMVKGALHRSHADVAVAISGIAGPGGGTAEKPVGTVCLAWGCRDVAKITATTRHFAGDRTAVRLQAACAALAGLWHPDGP
ncbi:MAG TPA: CinA family protein [Rhodocyclaceae bacterium]|nr:CinA family protein [Rhodocyclaceae bacterium]